MTRPAAKTDLLELVRKSRLVSEDALTQFLDNTPDLPEDPEPLAAVLVRTGLLTNYQSRLLLAGKYKGFFLDQYKILEPIGKGGMGIVYLAEQLSLQRRVAIKVLPRECATNDLDVARFYREARAAAALDHPNVVRVLDVKEGSGLHFITMEYVHGVTLQHTIEQSGPLPVLKAVSAVIQAAQGLACAHAQGIIHRDIKPANLMLSRNDEIKILDMGLARNEHDIKEHLTEQYGEGGFQGTADYISPEQALTAAVDGRSDIYSLGATLFALLTGSAPFGGSLTQKLLGHQVLDVPAPSAMRPEVPPGLDAVVQRMMAKNPDGRYQNATEVIEALSPWLAEAPTDRIRPSRAEESPTPSRTPTRDPVRPREQQSRNTQNTPTKPRPASRKLVLALVCLTCMVGGILAIQFAVGSGGTKGPEQGTTPVVAAEPTKQPQHMVVPVEQKPPLVLPRQHDNSLEGWYGPAERAVTSRDGKLLLVGGRDGAVIWDLEKGQVQTRIDHRADIRGLCFSLDGKLAITTGLLDGSVRASDTVTGLESWSCTTPKSQAWSALVTPDGKHVVIGYAPPGLARVLEIGTGNELHSFSVPSGHVKSLTPDGAELIVPEMAKKKLLFFNLRTGEMAEEWSFPVIARSAVVSTDGNTLFVGGGAWGTEKDGWVTAYDRHTKEVKRRFPVPFPLGSVPYLALSSSGRLLAAGSRGRHALVWEADSGKLVDILAHEKGYVGGLAFAQKDKILMTCAADGTVLKWPMEKSAFPLVQDFKAADLTPFKHTMKTRGSIREFLPYAVPAPWNVISWRENVGGEIEVLDHAGSRALALRPQPNQLSLQFACYESVRTLQEGKSYSVRLEYAAEGEATSLLEVRHGPRGPDKLAGITLPGTNAEWASAELTIESEKAQELHVYVIPLAKNGEQFFIRAVEIREK